MARSAAPLCTETLAILRADDVSLVDALLTSRGAYLEPDDAPRFLHCRARANKDSGIAVAADYTLPLGPQLDVLQLLCGQQPLPYTFLLKASAEGPSSPTAAPEAIPGQSHLALGGRRRDCVIQTVKQALYFRYRHPRDLMTLSTAEEEALVDVGRERRADVAAAMGKLYGRDARSGCPWRCLAVSRPSVEPSAGAGAPAASAAVGTSAPFVLRQAWVPFGGDDPGAGSGSSGDGGSDAPARKPTLTDAIMACIRPGAPSTGTDAPTGLACIGGAFFTLPTETDAVDAAEVAADALLPDGFVYVAVMLTG